MTPRSPSGKVYPITLVWDEADDGHSGWVAAIDALPGCVSQGATPKEAVERLTETAADWIGVAEESGLAIPEPRNTDDYSGRFVVRAPASLHERLVQEAAAEHVSLNQFVTNALAAAVGWRVAAREHGTLGGHDAREVSDDELIAFFEDAVRSGKRRQPAPTFAKYSPTRRKQTT
jgi:predicted RNase H-like HicB family nuclease